VTAEIDTFFTAEDRAFDEMKITPAAGALARPLLIST
jgi:hypothetical protein